MCYTAKPNQTKPNQIIYKVNLNSFAQLCIYDCSYSVMYDFWIPFEPACYFLDYVHRWRMCYCNSFQMSDNFFCFLNLVLRRFEDQF